MSQLPLLAGVNVLVVSEDPGANGIYERMLTAIGALVTVADSVDNALALAAQLLPDVAIADLRERGTLRLLLRMRAVAGLSEIPILAVVDASDGLSVKDGFNDVLEHPVDRADLLERVIGLSRRRRFG